MKTFTITLLVVCGVVILGAVVYLDLPKAKPASAATPPTQVAEQSPPASIPRQAAIPVSTPTQAVSQTASAPEQTATATGSATNEAVGDSSTNTIHKLARALLTAKSAEEKRALFDQLRKDNELEAVIADLKQQATDNPNNPEIPTTLGEAELNQIRALSESGTASTDQMGILAMQADQAFDAALKIDPNNWEAQYVKSASMYYWPSSQQTDNQEVQQLTHLIDQQESMPSNPEFAQTYLLLGNEYQKLGQQDKALATWQLGAQEFPNNSDLQKKVASGSGQ
jgi:tetratricopeptide (TPR) repeat protein